MYMASKQNLQVKSEEDFGNEKFNTAYHTVVQQVLFLFCSYYLECTNHNSLVSVVQPDESQCHFSRVVNNSKSV